MATKTYIKLLVLLFALSSLALQCDEPVVQFQYHFLENANLYPKKPFYRVGDTIWVEYANKDKLFFDQLTNRKVLLDTVQFSLSVEFVADYKTNNSALVKKAYCDFITLSGSKLIFYNAENFTRTTVFFGCEQDVRTKLGIVPRVRGDHRIRFFDQTYVSACPNKAAPRSVSMISYRLIDVGKEFVVKVE